MTDMHCDLKTSILNLYNTTAEELKHFFVTGESKSSEEAPEVEDLKSALQQKKTEAEELKAALEGRKKQLEEKNGELEEVKSELKELNNLLEEKSREADESMEKYCSLMVKVHKLEETNDALSTRLGQLSASQHTNSTDGTQPRRSARRSSSRHQRDNSENMTPPKSPQGSSFGKRGHRDISDKDGAQEVLHNLTKKIKANAVTTPKARSEQEDEEFRPEGLPELVQKGIHSSFGSPAQTVMSIFNSVTSHVSGIGSNLTDGSQHIVCMI